MGTRINKYAIEEVNIDEDKVIIHTEDLCIFEHN